MYRYYDLGIMYSRHTFEYHVVFDVVVIDFFPSELVILFFIIYVHTLFS